MADTRQKRPLECEAPDNKSEEDMSKVPASKKAKKVIHQLSNGYDCNFVDDLPEHIQVECPVCLCVLSKPHIVNCNCGSHFCETCIKPIKADRKPCPLCKGTFTTILLDRKHQRMIDGFLVYCSFKESGCEWEGSLKNATEHLNVRDTDDCKKFGCPYVKLECSHCHNKFERRHILNHEKSECTSRPICCEICGEFKSTFEDVTKNHIPLCPAQMVPCPKQCGIHISRKIIDKHLDNDCPLQLTDCVFSYAGCDVKVMRKDMTAHIAQSLAYHLSLQAVSHKELLDKQTAMQKEIDGLREKLDEKTSELNDEVEALKEDCSDLKSKQESLHTHISIIPVHLVLNNFVAKRKAGEIWYSQPFYSTPHGCRMRLKVYTNGHNAGKGTHISVYIQMLPGDFDHQLVWPFRGTIFVDLLDQSGDGDDWTERFEFDGQMLPETTPQVQKGNKNTEFGIDKYITLETVRVSFYDLENDSLYFKVTDERDNTCCVM